MPTYGYLCEDCDHHFETKKPMAQAGLPAQCPKCGQDSKRTYTYRPPIIMRPWGYNLKEGDKGYDSVFEHDREVPRSRYE